MSDVARPVVAVVGAGRLGKYICEELRNDNRFDVFVISRKKHHWADANLIPVHISDYTSTSILSVLNSTRTTALISFVSVTDTRYITIHHAFLTACEKSQSCKRFIPSEWSGDIEQFPLKPGCYGTTRDPFRQILRKSDSIEWTLFQTGWLMDYFLPPEKTHIKPHPNEFPVDPVNFRVCIRGTGNEPQSWTRAREVGKAVVELLAAPRWEPITYVVGEWSTFNDAVKLMESFYGRKFTRNYRSLEDIEHSLNIHAHDEDRTEIELAEVEEWMVLGCSACPRESTLRQRAKYFSNIEFSSLERLLILAETTKSL